jgi:predicted site-specific integrase-resolvase
MDMDALLPASLAAVRAGVSKQLFNYWRSSGKITPAAVRGGRALYRHLDVLQVERATRRSPRSHR